MILVQLLISDRPLVRLLVLKVKYVHVCTIGACKRMPSPLCASSDLDAALQAILPLAPLWWPLSVAGTLPASLSQTPSLGSSGAQPSSQFTQQVQFLSRVQL